MRNEKCVIKVITLKEYVTKVFNINLNIEALSPRRLIQFAETEAVTEDIFKEYLTVSLWKMRIYYPGYARKPLISETV